MPSTLGYWNIRGYCEAVKMMLQYVGEEYEQTFYHLEGPPTYKNDWFAKKFELGLELANLPYYNDGVVKMSQSSAILKYLGKKYGLEATTDEDVRRQDQALFQGLDIHNGLITIAYDQNFETVKVRYLELRLPMLLMTLERFLGDRDFVVGAKINYADFRVYEALAQNLIFAPDCLKNFPKLAAYVARFEALPAIKAFMESKRFIKEPMFAVIAYYSNWKREEEL